MSTTMRLFLGVFAVLAMASSIALVLRYTIARSRPHAVIDNLIDRINAWWVMVALVALAFAFGAGGVIVLFALFKPTPEIVLRLTSRVEGTTVSLDQLHQFADHERIAKIYALTANEIAMGLEASVVGRIAVADL